MLWSTLIPAMILVGLIYFLIIRLVPWRWLSYGLSLFGALALASTGKTHLVFSGIEVAGLGCLVTWLDPSGYWKTMT